LEKFAPSHTQISHLHALAAKPRSRGDNHNVPTSFVDKSILPIAGHNASVPASPLTFPPVEKFSGQRSGEDWQSFFNRREQRCVVLAEKETPEENQQRRQREAHAAKDLVPGRKGAKVYIWENVDGFLIRRAAGRKNYEGYWQDSGPKRRYNSFFDEWDICEEFDPTGGPAEEEDDDDEGTDNVFPLLPDNDTPHPSDNDSRYTSQSDLERIHNINQPVDDIIAEVEVNENAEVEVNENAEVEVNENAEVKVNVIADDEAYYRFGFVNPMGAVNEPAKKPDWKTVLKWLGFSWRGDSYETAPKKVIKAMIDFFGHLSLASKLADIPAELYDLRQFDADGGQQWNVRVRTETFFDKRYYFVSPHPTVVTSHFELMLSSAASVIEITRRQWGPDLVQIAHELLNRGIAFNTCIRGPSLKHVPSQIPRYGGLGYRPANYVPDDIDYKAYEFRRNQFIRSPRGRAAATQAGIVGRIIQEVIRVEDVCAGPSDSVFEDGICFWDGKESSVAYWDDKLTEDEIDLICGVYKVDTGL
jgi:hypothetical protein